MVILQKKFHRLPFIMTAPRTNYPNLNINSMTPGQLQILLGLGFQKIEIMQNIRVFFKGGSHVVFAFQGVENPVGKMAGLHDELRVVGQLGLHL